MKSLSFHLALAITCAFLPAANAGSIIVTRIASGDLDPGFNYDLDNFGSTDWKLYSTTSGDISKSGGAGISGLTSSEAKISSTSSYDPNFSWTGGNPVASASNSAQNFARTADTDTTGAVMNLTSTATTSLQTLYVFAGISRAAATLDLSLSDASATPVSVLYNIGNTFGHAVYKIDYFADANSTLNVSWTKTSHLGGTADTSHIRFQGAALTVPEPSSAALLALGSLCLLRRKRA